MKMRMCILTETKKGQLFLQEDLRIGNFFELYLQKKGFNLEGLDTFVLTEPIIKKIYNVSKKILDNPKLGEKLFPIKVAPVPWYIDFEDEYYLEDVDIACALCRKLLEEFNDFEKVYCRWDTSIYL